MHLYQFIFFVIRVSASIYDTTLNMLMLFCRWGAPARLLSDQGREFVAQVREILVDEFVYAN